MIYEVFLIPHSSIINLESSIINKLTYWEKKVTNRGLCIFLQALQRYKK